MKNTIKFLGIIALVAIIGVSFTACGGDDDDGGTTNTTGGLTINGLSAHNSKYFFATGTSGSTVISALATNGNAALISGGSVELKVVTQAGAAFTGSGTANFAVYIFNTANIQTEMTASPAPAGSVSVTLTDGKGTGTFTANP